MRNCKYTKEMLEEAVKNSYSYSGVMRYLGTGSSGSTHQWLKKRIVNLEINISHFTHRAPPGQSLIRNQNNILIYDLTSTKRVPRKRLLRAILDAGISYICDTCKNTGNWEGQRLILEIDHIDGQWQNNDLTNLRLLCPNCHSQTETNTSFNHHDNQIVKSVIKETVIPVVTLCLECGTEISKTSLRCKGCANKNKSKEKIVWPDINELLDLIKNMPLTKIGLKLNVSDNAIRKHIKKNGYDIQQIKNTNTTK
jgi:hypothetical protein